MRIVRSFLPPLATAALALIFMETVVRLGWVADFILPPPSAIFRSLFEDRDEFFTAFQSTASAAIIGLILSIAVGSAIAIGLSLSDLLKRAIYPYAIFFQTVPVVAIAPLLVIWFGFGRPTVIACAFIVSIFPIIASTLLGIESTDPSLRDLFRLYSASKLTELIKLRIPFAMPQVFSGIRIAAGLAVIGAVVGEFIGGGGLGSLVDAARTQQRIDKVFAAVLVSSFLGLLLLSVIQGCSWFVLRKWHASALERE